MYEFDVITHSYYHPDLTLLVFVSVIQKFVENKAKSRHQKSG